MNPFAKNFIIHLQANVRGCKPREVKLDEDVNDVALRGLRRSFPGVLGEQETLTVAEALKLLSGAENYVSQVVKISRDWPCSQEVNPDAHLTPKELAALRLDNPILRDHELPLTVAETAEIIIS
jgi:hypothetical protein